MADLDGSAEDTAAAEYELTLTPEDSKAISEFLSQNLLTVLNIPHIRLILSANRLKALDKDTIRRHQGADDNLIEHAIDHNMNGLVNMWSLERPSYLLNPLGSITCVLRDIKEKKVLSIGPRTEAEILALIALGFAPKNIRGLDLISYLPCVDVGDMHDMPYGDSSFDVIVLGWVLAYSSNQEQAAREVMRVARPGAVIAIGCEYDGLSEENREAIYAEELKTDRKLTKTSTDTNWSAERILKLFDGRVKRVYFQNDETEDVPEEASAVMVIFQLT